MLFWSKLDAKEKANYVAQVATTLSFLAASAFSYASWREARLAREDQRSFFASEKVPIITASSVDWFYVGRPGQQMQNYLSVKFMNKGQSDAKIIGYSLKYIGIDRSDIDLRSLHPNFLPPERMLQRDDDITLILISTDNLKKLCECEITDKPFRPFEVQKMGNGANNLIQVSIEYEDILGNKKDKLFNFVQ